MAEKLRKLGLKVALAGLAAYRSGIQNINEGNARTRQSMDEVAEGSKKLDLGMAALSGAMMALASKGISFVVNQFKNLANEIKVMASEAGVVAGLKGAFEGLSASIGVTGAEMLEKFRVATGGMVTMKDAMMSFNKAAQLISVDFASMIPDAMKYLGKVSTATGANLDYLLDSLVVGVGRLSPMILDNLSIQVSLAEASERAAEMFGLQKDELSKTQKQLGMANVVMEKLARNTAHMPDVTGSAKAQMAALGTVIADTRTEIGLRFLPLLSESMNVMNMLANAVLPKLVPAAEMVANALMGIVKWIKEMIPSQKILEGLKNVFIEIGVGITEALSGPIKVWGNWIKIIKAQISGIAKIIFGDFVGSIGEAADYVANFFYDTLTPAINTVAKYLTYFFRVARDVFVGLEALLKGDTERATKFFSQAFNTAISTVIALMKRAAAQVVEWGRMLIASYSKGIVDGIKAYLSRALQMVAGFIQSLMAPGSPPKFLPDIGTWGAGAMNEYLKGMGHADFGLLSGFTSQFQSELAGLVQAGDLDASQFADTFFELRGVVTEVMDTFRETGQIAANALDPVREKLGRTGEALAELIEKQLGLTTITKQMEELQTQSDAALTQIAQGLNEVAMQEKALDLALQPFINSLERLKAEEAVVTDELKRQFEAGEIGVEEYEDRVKAAKEETAAAERALNLEKAAQTEARQGLETQEAALDLQEQIIKTQAEEQMAALEAQAQAMGDEIAILEDRLAFHRETLGVMAQQEQMLEAMQQAAAGVGVGELGEIELPVMEMPTMEDMPQVLESLDEFRTRMENMGDMTIEPFDLGELLPDVEETKKEISGWFGKGLEGIQTAIQKSPIAQWILNALFVQLPIVVERLRSWIEQNFPIAYAAITTSLKALLEGDMQGALQPMLDWFEYTKTAIIIWWEMNIAPVLRSFKEWWDTNWPIMAATAVIAWTLISGVVMSVINTISEIAGPQLETAFEWFTSMLDNFGITWGDVWDAVVKATGIVVGIIGAAFLGVVAIVTGLISGIVAAVGKFVQGWVTAFYGLTEMIAGFLVTFKGFFEVIAGIFTLDFPRIINGLKIAWTGFFTFIQGLLGMIAGAFTMTLGTVLTLVGGFIQGVIDFFVNLYDELVGNSIIPDMLTKMYDDFVLAFTNTLTAVGEFVGGVIQWFIDLYDGFFGPEGTVTKFTKSLFDNITGTIDDVIDAIELKIDEFKTMGGDLMEGMIGGIKEKMQSVIDSVTGVIKAVIAAGKKLLGIESPSKVWADMGQKSMEGYEVGMNDMLPKLEQNMLANVAPVLTMGSVPNAMNTSATTNNVDRSTRYGDKIISMPVTVIEGKTSMAQFKQTLRQVLNERG